MIDDRARWDQRYAARTHPPRYAPDAVLVRHRSLLRGDVLDVACGEGANTLLAAMCGARATGVDVSNTGLDRARALAGRFGLRCCFEHADVTSGVSQAKGTLDAVLVFFFRDERLYDALPGLLRTGGVAFVRTFNWRKANTHPRFAPSYLLERGELRERFDGFEVLDASDGEDGLNNSWIVARKRQKVPAR